MVEVRLIREIYDDARLAEVVDQYRTVLNVRVVEMSAKEIRLAFSSSSEADSAEPGIHEFLNRLLYLSIESTIASEST